MRHILYLRALQGQNGGNRVGPTLQNYVDILNGWVEHIHHVRSAFVVLTFPPCWRLRICMRSGSRFLVKWEARDAACFAPTEGRITGSMHPAQTITCCVLSDTRHQGCRRPFVAGRFEGHQVNAIRRTLHLPCFLQLHHHRRLEVSLSACEPEYKHVIYSVKEREKRRREDACSLLAKSGSIVLQTDAPNMWIGTPISGDGQES